MVAEQLDLFAKHRGKPSVSPKEEYDFIVLLERERGWVNKKLAMARLGLNERKFRMIRKNNCDKIIFGQCGYKHINYASAEELWECINFLRSQAQSMNDEVGEYIKVGKERKII